MEYLMSKQEMLNADFRYEVVEEKINGEFVSANLYNTLEDAERAFAKIWHGYVHLGWMTISRK